MHRTRSTVSLAEWYRLKVIAAGIMPEVCFPCVWETPVVLRKRDTVRKKTSSKRDTSAKAETAFLCYRFTGHPTEEQASLMLRTFGCCRKVWNLMTADKLAAVKDGKPVSGITPAFYKKQPEYAYLREVDSLALANVQLNNERAFSEWFAGEKRRPRFKAKQFCRRSYTTNTVGNNIKLTGHTLRLPKVGDIGLVVHRPVRSGGILKSVTVCLEPDGKWYFSIKMEYPAEQSPVRDAVEDFFSTGDPTALKHIGLDMSLPHLYIDSTGSTPSYINDGTVVTFEKAYRKLESRLAREQRKLSRMQRGSSNYNKQCLKIAGIHAKIRHQRQDFLHQMTARLAREYDLISIEDLNISAMKKSLRLGKSVSDNGWGMFTTLLADKCERNGSLLVKVDRWFPSSKTCTRCGHIHRELKLSDRLYVCPGCGTAMDRDHGAAVNIDREGLRIFTDYVTRAMAA